MRVRRGALAVLVGALAAFAESPESLVDRGVAAAEIGEYADALRDLEAADRTLPAEHPRRCDLAFGLGLARYGVERFADAVADFTHAIALDESKAEPYGWRGLARLHLHEDAAAAEDFTRCFARDPKMRAVFETFAAEVRANRRPPPTQPSKRSE